MVEGVLSLEIFDLKDVDRLRQKSNCMHIEFLYKPNNWLKRHHIPMRRKPFKKEYFTMDEFHMLTDKMNFIKV